MSNHGSQRYSFCFNSGHIVCAAVTELLGKYSRQSWHEICVKHHVWGIQKAAAQYAAAVAKSWTKFVLQGFNGTLRYGGHETDAAFGAWNGFDISCSCSSDGSVCQVDILADAGLGYIKKITEVLQWMQLPRWICKYLDYYTYSLSSFHNDRPSSNQIDTRSMLRASLNIILFFSKCKAFLPSFMV